MGGKSQPDFGDVAASQGEENRAVVRDQLYANRPTQYTPWGYTQWTSNPYTDPATGETTTQWSQTQGLTPELQDILNKQIAIQSGRTDLAGMMTGRLGNEFGQQMNWGNLTPMGGVPTAQFTLPEDVQRGLDYSDIPGVGDPTELRARAEDAVYQKGASRLAPRFESARQAAEIRMRNQGLGPEDAAWKQQMQQINQQETDAYGQLQADAVRQGLSEQQQLFGQEMGLRDMYTGERDRMGQFYNQAGQQAYGQAAASNQQNWQMALQQSQYANQIRQQQIAEEMQKRGFSLNEINALLSGQQVQTPQMPNFTPSGQAQPAPIYQGAVDQSNFEQAQQQGLWSGIGNLAGAGLTAWGLRG